MDGFPRTVESAIWLDEQLAMRGQKIDMAASFDVDHAALEERICGRR